jgi:hypothetical protein
VVEAAFGAGEEAGAGVPVVAFGEEAGAPVVDVEGADLVDADVGEVAVPEVGRGVGLACVVAWLSALAFTSPPEVITAVTTAASTSTPVTAITTA